jgi:hypothetical protein
VVVVNNMPMLNWRLNALYNQDDKKQYDENYRRIFGKPKEKDQGGSDKEVCKTEIAAKTKRATKKVQG